MTDATIVVQKMCSVFYWRPLRGIALAPKLLQMGVFFAVYRHRSAKWRPKRQNQPSVFVRSFPGICTIHAHKHDVNLALINISYQIKRADTNLQCKQVKI